MADIHIDNFYKDVAKICVRLYKSFPNKIVLYVDEIAGEATPDEFGLHSERYLSALSTMIWLAEEGYIRFADCIKQDALDQAVLTEKAFLLLNSRSKTPKEALAEKADELPDSVVDQLLRNITLLRDALKSGSSIAIEQQVSYFLR